MEVNKKDYSIYKIAYYTELLEYREKIDSALFWNHFYSVAKAVKEMAAGEQVTIDDLTGDAPVEFTVKLVCFFTKISKVPNLQINNSCTIVSKNPQIS